MVKKIPDFFYFLFFYTCGVILRSEEYYSDEMPKFLIRKKCVVIWQLEHSCAEIDLVCIFFFRVETYSGIFKPQISVVTRINPRLRDSYTQELQVVFKRTLLANLVTFVGTPSIGSASENTCIQIDLDSLNPFVDKTSSCLTVIVPLRTTLEKILSRNWVVGQYN